MRTFTFTDGAIAIKYFGLDRKVMTAEYIAVVLEEGEPTVYALDEPSDVGVLEEYLSAHWAGLYSVVGVFKRA